MNVLDLFAGIGGFTYAGHLLGGFTTTQFVENNAYCQQVLRKNFPHVPIHDDINTFDTSFKFGEYDLITAGFPCQDLSSAGKQAGLREGTRSSLFYRVIEIAKRVRPKYILFENVANTISHGNGETFQQILYEIAKADAWPILGATSYYHALGQSKFWDDLQDRTIIGTPCVEPRVENVPVRMPLPPAKDASSIFQTQKSGGAKSAFM